jgi:hypothetical protein
MAEEKIKWHPAFAAALQLELKEYKEYLDYITEKQLNEEPLKIDVLVIKKKKDIAINNVIGKIFGKHNIFEYKSPKDYLSVDDYFKVKAYAYLYKVTLQKEKIDLKEMTISFAATRYPKKLMEYLKKELKLEIKRVSNGIYYIEGTDIKTQIIVIKELQDDEIEYINLLQFNYKNKNKLKMAINEYFKNTKDSLYSVFMNVLREANAEQILEVYRDMGIAKISEENRVFMLDMVKELKLDKEFEQQGIEKGKEEGIKKGKEEGIKEGIIKTARNLLKEGAEVAFVVKITGLSEAEVLKLK